MKNKLKLLLLPVLFLVFSCDTISDGAKEQAKNTENRIESTRKLVKKNDSTYASYIKTVGNLSQYSEKEKLPGNFTTALEILREADTLYKKRVNPLLDKKSAFEPQLLRELSVINSNIKKAVEMSQYPKLRMELISNIDKNVDKYKTEADKKLSIAKGQMSNLQDFTKSYYSTYPQRKEDIDEEIAIGNKHLAMMIASNDSITSNYERKKANGNYDLTVLADSYNSMLSTTDTIITFNHETKILLKELDKSYTKVLKDMQVKFYVEVGRTSWDDYSDFNTDKDYIYPIREVDEETFKYFDGLADNVILASDLGWGKDITVRVDKAMWNTLKIDHNEKYPSGDDDSEFWLSNTVVKYYHSYVIEDNGVINEQANWTEVDEDTFYDNLEHLGMSIMSKPLGFFEDEAMEEAAPAGMTYVGNEKYGEWKKDSNGETFWSFYGKYMFFSNLMGGNRFSRGEYDDYNRNYRWTDRNYYGSKGEHKYGTRGTNYAKTPSYSNSNYRKSYATSTKSEFGHSNLRKSYRTQAPVSRTQTSSARTGSSRRGGGPGGGGK